MNESKPQEGEYSFSDLSFEASHRAMKDYQDGWLVTHPDEVLNADTIVDILRDPGEGSLYYSTGERSGERLFVTGAVLQDLYHYALRALDDGMSVFAGDRDYKGLLGRLECYDLAWEKLRRLYLGVDYGLRHPRDIQDITQLKPTARKLLNAVKELAEQNKINPRTGNKSNA